MLLRTVIIMNLMIRVQEDDPFDFVFPLDSLVYFYSYIIHFSYASSLMQFSVLFFIKSIFSRLQHIQKWIIPIKSPKPENAHCKLHSKDSCSFLFPSSCMAASDIIFSAGGGVITVLISSCNKLNSHLWRNFLLSLWTDDKMTRKCALWVLQSWKNMK